MQLPEERFTLKQITNSIRKTIEQRYNRTYWVTAEMHKLNTTRKGHCYPELVQKEDGLIIAEMRGTIWKSNFDRIQQRFASIVKEPLRDGMELLFLVKIVYHPIYNLGLEIVDIDPNYTLGALQRERQETLERLNREGILNANQQIEMALLPKRLAIISQADSKGYSDFVTLLNGHPKRYRFNTFLFEATLQGDAAIRSIQDQLKRISSIRHHFDAVVIIRGGGGEIGMHCYNNYELTKAVATFPLPVLTGIGHSTNLTVCEMISFRTGITPSDMAYFLLSIFEELDQPLDEFQLKLPKQIAHFMQSKRHLFEHSTRAFQQETRRIIVKERNQFMHHVKSFEYQVKQRMSHAQQVLIEQQKVVHTASNYYMLSKRKEHASQLGLIGVHSKSFLERQKEKLQQQTNHLTTLIPNTLVNEQNKLNQLQLHVKLLDPITILQRGYSIVTNSNGALTGKNQAQLGDKLIIRTETQSIETKVEKVNRSNEN